MRQIFRFSFGIVFLAALAMCGSIGCHQGPSSNDSFRLTVKPVLDDSDVQVMILHIEAGGSPHYQVWNDGETGGHSNRTVFNAGFSDSEKCQAEVKIYAFQISPSGDNGNDYVKSSTGGGWTLRAVPQGTPLSETFSVTVQDGTYPLNVPLVIGREDGAELKFAVVSQETLEAMMGDRPWK